MGNFRVSDKVICINDDWEGKNLIYPAVSDIYEITFPKQGRVYTVYSTKSIKNCSGPLSLTFWAELMFFSA